jgi:hypothetical protein
MRHSHTALLACLIMGLALAACSPALDWRTVRPEDASGLQASFPCKPDAVERSVNLPGLPGGPVVMHLVSCKTGEVTWALNYFDAKDILKVSPALAANSQALRDNLDAAARLGGKVAASPVVATDLGSAGIAGMTPHPLARHWRLLGQRLGTEGAHAPLEVHAWHFSNGLMVFQATVWRPVPPADAKESTEAVETFAHGFKFSE